LGGFLSAGDYPLHKLKPTPVVLSVAFLKFAPPKEGTFTTAVSFLFPGGLKKEQQTVLDENITERRCQKKGQEKNTTHVFYSD
jgi:hypothetical protein